MNAEAAEEYAYRGTLARIEPDIAPIDRAAADTSIAISLKLIADVLDRVEAKLTAPSLFEIAKAVQALVEADNAKSPTQRNTLP